MKKASHTQTGKDSTQNVDGFSIYQPISGNYFAQNLKNPSQIYRATRDKIGSDNESVSRSVSHVEAVLDASLEASKNLGTGELLNLISMKSR